MTKRRYPAALFSLLLINAAFASFVVCTGNGGTKRREGAPAEPSRFEDVGYHKKKLDNGSNTRVYSVYVRGFQESAEIWSDMEQYAKGKMHTQGGSTTVFFFSDRSNTPDVTFVGEQFDSKYEQYCIAAYWKYPSGVEKFSKYPFRQ